jgi:hypothetical protein
VLIIILLPIFPTSDNTSQKGLALFIIKKRIITVVKEEFYYCIKKPTRIKKDNIKSNTVAVPEIVVIVR